MQKLLIGIGDIHLRNKAYYQEGLAKFANWFDSKFPDNFKNNTEIILAGDIFNKVSMLPSTAARAIDLFNLFYKKASTVYAILGNHDYGLSKYKIVNTKAFLEKNNIVVIDDLCEFQTKLGFNLLCLPWKYATTHQTVNKFLEDKKSREYDACIAHWELESLYGSTFVELKDIKAKAFMCGHIHSHKTNPKYLGSILPNNIEEVKDNDPSIIKVLLEKEDTSKVVDFEIPNFVNLQSVKIETLADINNLEKGIYYKILYPKNLSIKDINNQAKLAGINIYSLTKLLTDKLDIDLNKNLSNIKEYTAQSHQEILQAHKASLNIDEELFTSLSQVIDFVAKT